jgi:large subunit ribosomal protein L9
MKVILLDYVYKQGVAGEVIDVADGFARNFLIPRGLAVKATPGELKRATKLREQAAAKRAALEDRVNELARIIDGVELVFGRRAASTGKLFGSVTTQEIADALMEATDVDINRRRISQQPLREIGTHEVPVRLGTEISPVLKITIVREEELAEYLARRETDQTEDTGDEAEAGAETTAEAAPAEEAETSATEEALPEAADEEPAPVVEAAAETDNDTKNQE